jgi:undecaprenol kinase
VLPKKFYIYNPFKSFKYAFSGIKTAFSRETNLVVQLIMIITIAVMAFGFNLPKYWIVINLFAGFQVLALELLNTAFETLCDIVDKEFNYQIKIVKDIAAGAVLVFSLLWLMLIFYQVFLILQKFIY